MSGHSRVIRTVHGERMIRYRFVCGEHEVNKTLTITGRTKNGMRKSAEPSIDAMLLMLHKEYHCNDAIVNEEDMEMKGE